MNLFLTAANGAEGYGGRILGFDLAFLTSMWMVWLNMIVIILLLSWLLYKPVKKFLNDRRNRIMNELETAAENLRASEETRGFYDGKLANIMVERDEILDEARKMAGEREAAILAEANSEAGLIRERAKRDIELDREKAKDEMRKQIIHISAAMAEQLIGESMDEETRNQILNRAIAEMGDASWTN